ncbi:MAG: RNA polymerase sigma factor [Planctomycetota bacterium]|nr:RNA polymerase sigma factor [Planctomycetota bacterium]MDI6787803.1 RNA polymerase sigma factor [Planctomycetota bacterium]
MSSHSEHLVQDGDTILMLAFQKGDKKAFDTLFYKYQQTVVNVITRYVGNKSLAEDLAQDVFLRIYQARNKYQPIAPFKHYLFTCVHNLCVNEIRDATCHKTKTLDFNDKFGWADDGEPVGESQEKMEIKLEVKSAIEDLPPQQRMAIILEKYENLSYEEIANVMKQSVSAVKSTLWRARQTLKEKLKKYISE